MAYFKFTKSIFNNQKIQLFNKVNIKRFTYIDDIINEITLILRNKSSNLNPNVINIGSESHITCCLLLELLKKFVKKRQ